MEVEVLGIRHHGVGSAINTLKRLDEFKPDFIIIEGPQELMQSLQQVELSALTPPVAILAYSEKNLQDSHFYPFAKFSPEWQAIEYAQRNSINFTTADTPLKHYFALQEEEQKKQEIPPLSVHHNPLEEIAKLDGISSSEVWWNERFEEQPYEDTESYFKAIMEVMKALRETYINEDYVRNEQREAFMREAIRKAKIDGYKKVLFICGAWHAPALLQYKEKKKDDKALITKLPKTKVSSSWIPWSNQRLSWHSGYGAGIESPGWYEHLWKYREESAKRWLSYSAKVFRKNKIDISTAHIIEAYNLADALSLMRFKTNIGIHELDEAIISVMCMGDAILLNYIRKELTIGNKIGKVPADLSTLPLQIDFETKIKKYRFSKSEEEKAYTLDLRTDRGLQKSLFLYQLSILSVPWGSLKAVRSKGNFKEVWSLKWTPEVEFHIIDKAIWGNTVDLAAAKYVEHIVQISSSMKEIVHLLDLVLLAQLFDSVKTIIKAIETLTSQSYDVHLLISTVIELMDIVRYSDVRKTDTQELNVLINNLLVRVISNLSMACYGIDEDVASDFAKNISSLHERLIRMPQEEMIPSWIETLEDIAQLEEGSFLIQGTVHRILLDFGHYTPAYIAIEFSKALSIGQDPLQSAQWIEGFLKGSVTILIVDNTIWNILYQWVSSLDEEQFYNLLPLLRRSFSKFSQKDRFQIGQKAQKGLDLQNSVVEHGLEQGDDFNLQNAQRALDITVKLLYRGETYAK